MPTSLRCRRSSITRDGASRIIKPAYLAERARLLLRGRRDAQTRGGVYGNVTLSRWKFDLVRPLDLTVIGREERGALRTDIHLANHVLHVFNVHLGVAHRERRRQAVRLMDRDLLRAVDIRGPRIVLGDFNEWTHGLVTRTLSAEFHLTDLRLHLAWTRAYPALLPLLHLDHIYFDHHMQVESARFHRSRLALIASDHLPLVADFKMT